MSPLETLINFCLNMKLKQLFFFFVVVGGAIFLFDRWKYSDDFLTETVESDGAASSKGKDGAGTARDRDAPASSGSRVAAPINSSMSIERNSIDDDDEKHSGPIHVVIILKNSENNANLKKKFEVTVSSILEHTSASLQWHVFGDDRSLQFAGTTLKREYSSLTHERRRIFESTVKVYDLQRVVDKIRSTVEVFMKYFTGRQVYYKDELFFLSTGLHLVLDPSIDRVIMIDADLKFKSDIKHLYDLFHDFSPSNLIGLAYEMQPVYRHLFWSYRGKNKGTLIGEPAGEGGNPGFNSGVLLMRLDRLRDSQIYAQLCQESTISSYVFKYDFTNAHLGDQDFFTLVSFEHPELYYRLPCSWNRQLCRWWEDKGYSEIFYKYFDCNESKIHVFHGNCGSAIPA